MPDIGVPELLVILVIVLVIFGAGRLTDIMGALGKGVAEFRRGSETPPQAATQPPAPGQAAAVQPAVVQPVAVQAPVVQPAVVQPPPAAPTTFEQPVSPAQPPVQELPKDETQSG